MEEKRREVWPAANGPRGRPYISIHKDRRSFYPRANLEANLASRTTR
jgi:hypothetical protein